MGEGRNTSNTSRIIIFVHGVTEKLSAQIGCSYRSLTGPALRLSLLDLAQSSQSPTAEVCLFWF